MIIQKGETKFKVNTILDDFFKSPFSTLKNLRTSISHTLFWRSNKQGRWEEKTYHIFHKFLNKNNSYIDIGAWIGLTVLYGTQNSKYCYAIEPDDIARNVLIKNIQKNPKIKNITIIKECASNKNGTINLGGKNLGDSMSSIMNTKNQKKSIKVNCMTFNNLINKYKIHNCNFIKMDIEGAEAIVIPTMHDFFKKNKNTSIMISLHPHLLNSIEEDIKNIIKFAEKFDYILDENLNKITKDFVKNKLKQMNGFDIILTNKII